ncbi:cytochrome d ubiquinol oxidase subunit II [Allokutzneria sp. A3M-2-11 16]|uniref:cytochrome d ubiquinol oxidase subunit II n=1 Tax=Allokutzneria sp. A3M-2-11 16 TaxID=2962043 RepID=UPI0020B6D9B1|nr:cytochrome d ubiquinol oxidase subunit II [Allokutzneria sp. A3M-2-11 16]MCP3801643.1 cytochrome d ubiquinol oxidase subunit II [Allokutzneria sp. A3M-2-11 16]
MELVAAGLLAFFAIGYFVLGGADIGLGMLLPFLGRTPAERRLVITGIAPVFLGNEVWLVATAGVLVGAFPDLEGKLLTDQFPAVVALLLGWVARDAGLWMRHQIERRTWQGLCDTAITLGSWTAALAWGWVFSSLLVGTANPIIGVAIALLFAVHGLAFAALRLSGPLRERAAWLSGPLTEFRAFLLTAAVMTLLCLAIGFRLPLVDSAADPATLRLLVPVLTVITPVLVLAQVWLWRLFRHRVERPMYL